LGQGAKYEITQRAILAASTSFSCIESNCNHEDYLVAGLIQGTDGNFYGTTEQGGTGVFGGGVDGSQYGGSVFKITPGHSIATLYSFCSQSDCTDGQAPMGALVEGTTETSTARPPSAARYGVLQRQSRHPGLWHRVQDYAGWHTDHAL
jgi:hypothetical protein